MVVAKFDSIGFVFASLWAFLVEKKICHTAVRNEDTFIKNVFCFGMLNLAFVHDMC